MPIKRKLSKRALQSLGIRVAPNGGIFSFMKFASLRATAFPRFQNPLRSKRRHFRSFRIRFAPSDGISAVSEFHDDRYVSNSLMQLPCCFFSIFLNKYIIFQKVCYLCTRKIKTHGLWQQ